MQPKLPSRQYTVLIWANPGGAPFTREVSALDDAEAIVRSRHLAGFGVGFEVKDGERIVHATPVREAPVSPAKWNGSRFGEGHVRYLELAAEVERRRQSGVRVSPVYRIYLRDRDRNVVSGHTIAIGTDAQARNIAAVLGHAAADVCVSVEVWKGEILLMAGRAPPPQRAELTQRAQQVVVDTEITLSDSRTALAESRSLLDAIEAWTDDAGEQRRVK